MVTLREGRLVALLIVCAAGHGQGGQDTVPEQEHFKHYEPYVDSWFGNQAKATGEPSADITNEQAVQYTDAPDYATFLKWGERQQQRSVSQTHEAAKGLEFTASLVESQAGPAPLEFAAQRNATQLGGEPNEAQGGPKASKSEGSHSHRAVAATSRAAPAAAEAARLRQDAQGVLKDLEAYVADLKKSASSKAEVQREAEEDLEAVAKQQLQELHHAIAPFQNCSKAAKECAREARHTTKSLRHRGEQRLQERSRTAASAARLSARMAQKQVRQMAAEVRRKTDKLVRVAQNDEQAAAFADGTDRRAEELASEAERHIETLARRREEAFRHQSSRAQQRLRRDVQEGHFLAYPWDRTTSFKSWMLLGAVATSAALVVLAASGCRRDSTSVFMPERLLG